MPNGHNVFVASGRLFGERCAPGGAGEMTFVRAAPMQWRITPSASAAASTAKAEGVIG